MPLRFEPRFFERKPQQCFWLRANASIVGQGKLGLKARTQFRREVHARLGKKWPAGARNDGNPPAQILFKQTSPQNFLKRIKPIANGTSVPIGDAGKAGAESFRVEIHHERIAVYASTATGFRYALSSLFDQFDPQAGFFSGGTFEDEPAFPFRAFLLNFAHDYLAPRKGEKRVKIKPYDRDLADELIKQIADARCNAVILDIENAVRYQSHPQIARSHSYPMEAFRRLVRTARDVGLEVIPKTNFSKSPKYRHNDWFEPYHEMPDGSEYYRRAGQIMAELISIARPRYYHIGMDEDHRETRIYVNTVKALRTILLKKKVTPIIWIDLDKPHQPEINLKMMEALKQMPRKKLLINFWQYSGWSYNRVSDLMNMGYTVLGASNARPHCPASANAAFALRAYQQGATGMVGTCWTPITKEYEPDYRTAIRASGRAFWLGG